MPRFAFALPYAPARVDAWDEVIAELTTERVSDHRRWLLDRGIFRERLWVQRGADAPPVALVLWDCDDVATAIRSCAHEDRSAHERWMIEVLSTQSDGDGGEAFALPRPEVVSGTTTQATAAANAHVMFGLAVPDEGVDALRTLVERIEVGDLARPHAEFLARVGISEEWLWLQPPHAGLGWMLLGYWIGDDLHEVWGHLAVGEDTYARVVRQALLGLLLDLDPGDVARWDLDQVAVLHVRRSDSSPTPLSGQTQRLRAAVVDGRWGPLERVLAEEVEVTAAGTTHRLDAAAACARLAEHVGVRAAGEALTSTTAILLPLTGTADPPAQAAGALLAAVVDRRITSVQVIARWPPP